VIRVASRAPILFTLAVCSAACHLACNPTVPPPALAPNGAESHDTDQSHLLLFPESNGESLLGRTAQRAPDGSWTLADTRAPGCEVSARHEKAAFHTSRKLDAHSLTSLAGGYARVVSLEAKFGRKNTADIDIHNTEILHADLRGACGDLVVDTVFVGHGKRSIKASAEAGGSADVHTGVLSASPKIDAAQSQDDDVAWTDDQAYGFTVHENAKVEPLEIRVDLPSIVDEGAKLAVHFEAAQPAWLVVYYIDGHGHADVLWPSNEEPAPRVAPDAPAVLPSPRELSQGISYKFTLLEPGRPARETLVVYGFADKRDFDALKPAAGTASADGPKYAAELTQKLQTVPMSRWSRAVVGYVIEPKR
jgi:hypothetical protein